MTLTPEERWNDATVYYQLDVPYYSHGPDGRKIEDLNLALLVGFAEHENYRNLPIEKQTKVVAPLVEETFNKYVSAIQSGDDGKIAAARGDFIDLVRDAHIAKGNLTPELFVQNFEKNARQVWSEISGQQGGQFATQVQFRTEQMQSWLGA